MLKKAIVIISFIGILLLSLFSFFQNSDYLDLGILFISTILLFIIPKINIKNHYELWKNIMLYSICCFYSFVCITIMDYLNINPVIKIAFLIPGIIGIVIATIKSYQYIKKGRK